MFSSKRLTNGVRITTTGIYALMRYKHMVHEKKFNQNLKWFKGSRERIFNLM